MHVKEITVNYNYLTTRGDILSIKANQLRELITEVLTEMGLYSDSARELLMLTAAQESQCGNYIEQIRGPAKGIFQMEPATEKDIWINFLAFKQDLAAEVGKFDITPALDDLDLEANLAYQIAIARIHYLRDSNPIPPAENIEHLAAYYKRVWNTYKGKATVQEAIDNYHRYALEG